MEEHEFKHESSTYLFKSNYITSMSRPHLFFYIKKNFLINNDCTLIISYYGLLCFNYSSLTEPQ